MGLADSILEEKNISKPKKVFNKITGEDQFEVEIGSGNKIVTYKFMDMESAKKFIKKVEGGADPYKTQRAMKGESLEETLSIKKVSDGKYQVDLPDGKRLSRVSKKELDKILKDHLF